MGNNTQELESQLLEEDEMRLEFLNGSAEICEEDLRVETNGNTDTSPLAQALPNGHKKGMRSMVSQSG